MIEGGTLYVLYGALGLYILLLGLAAVFDLWKFIIPNMVSAALLLAFIPAALILPFDVDWLSHLGAAAACFAVTAAFYAFGWFGAGDVKLLTAISFWAGFQAMPQLVFNVSLAGGALALVLLISRHLAKSRASAESPDAAAGIPRLFRMGEKIPYGVAIAAGAMPLAFKLPHLGLYL